MFPSTICLSWEEPWIIMLYLPSNGYQIFLNWYELWATCLRDRRKIPPEWTVNKNCKMSLEMQLTSHSVDVAAVCMQCHTTPNNLVILISHIMCTGETCLTAFHECSLTQTCGPIQCIISLDIWLIRVTLFGENGTINTPSEPSENCITRGRWSGHIQPKQLISLLYSRKSLYMIMIFPNTHQRLMFEG